MTERNHRRTDPACHYHRAPRGLWSRLRYDRARGRSCDLCMRVRALATNPAYARFAVWADETELTCTRDGSCPIPGHTTLYRTAEWNPPPLDGQKITTWRGHR